MDRLDQLFQQFLRERTYVNNVTTSTCEWQGEIRAAMQHVRLTPLPG